jgi:glucosamine-6-phosphate deaminase
MPRVTSLRGARAGTKVFGRNPVMVVCVFEYNLFLANAAAAQASNAIRRAIRDHGQARIVAATGASQLSFLDSLIKTQDIDWLRVELFHLDEYIGLPVSHPASFRKYLLERFIRPAGIKNYHLLNGEGDYTTAIQQVGAALQSAPVDVAFVGVGENAHLAFNDPPADFQTEDPYLVVDLDEACRRQQVGEGWFADLSEVPKRAISMSIQQILKSKEIVCVVPDARKSRAIQICLEGPISPAAPASILRNHPNTTMYLDKESA